MDWVGEAAAAADEAVGAVAVEGWVAVDLGVACMSPHRSRPRPRRDSSRPCTCTVRTGGASVGVGLEERVVDEVEGGLALEVWEAEGGVDSALVASD